MQVANLIQIFCLGILKAHTGALASTVGSFGVLGVQLRTNRLQREADILREGGLRKEDWQRQDWLRHQGQLRQDRNRGEGTRCHHELLRALPLELSEGFICKSGGVEIIDGGLVIHREIGRRTGAAMSQLRSRMVVARMT